MNIIKPDSPAYPGMEYDNTAGQRYHYGLTKRELFAAMAMQGLCSSPDHLAVSHVIAEDAVHIADAIIKELNEDQS